MNRDRLTRERRSWNMSRIRGKHTAPELIVRSLLHRLGYRFRLHVRIAVEAKGRGSGVEGRGNRGRARHSVRAAPPPENRKSEIGNQKSLTVRPDIVLPKYKTAIFVHGCYWHRHRGCKNCTTPTHRREWWVKKLEGNAARDKLHQRALRELGWRVIVVWECQGAKPKSLAKMSRQLKNAIKPLSRSQTKKLLAQAPAGRHLAKQAAAIVNRALRKVRR